MKKSSILFAVFFAVLLISSVVVVSAASGDDKDDMSIFSKIWDFLRKIIGFDKITGHTISYEGSGYGCISGYKWRDWNENKVLGDGANEVKLEDWPISLWSGPFYASKLASTKTDYSGKYTFCGLEQDELYMICDGDTPKKDVMTTGFTVTEKIGLGVGQTYPYQGLSPTEGCQFEQIVSNKRVDYEDVNSPNPDNKFVDCYVVVPDKMLTDCDFGNDWYKIKTYKEVNNSDDEVVPHENIKFDLREYLPPGGGSEGQAGPTIETQSTASDGNTPEYNHQLFLWRNYAACEGNNADQGEGGIWEQTSPAPGQTDNELGCYVFSRLKPRVPDTVLIFGCSVSESEHLITCDFRNEFKKNYSISGIKYFDLNKNKDKDGGEPLLDGWTIRLYEDENGAWSLKDQKITAGGKYKFEGLYAGKDYLVCEDLKTEDWVQISPGPVPTANCDAVIEVGPGGRDCYKFESLDMDSVACDFGNDNGNSSENYTITVTKSIEGEAQGKLGVCDDFDIKLKKEGVVIKTKRIDSQNNPVQFKEVYGNVEVCEEPVYDFAFLQTQPVLEGCYSFSPLSQDENVEFKNLRKFIIKIKKFFDENGNGTLDAGEKGMPDWEFNIYKDGNLYAGPLLTDDQGEKSITVEGSGTYKICETVKDGYDPTTSPCRKIVLDKDNQFEPGCADLKIHEFKFGNDNSSRGAAAVADFGDAPDSTNHFGGSMTAYPRSNPPGVLANFPSVFDPETGAPQGPCHYKYAITTWLGSNVSLENDADLLIDNDEDITNLNVTEDASDRDYYDDGLEFPFRLDNCVQNTFKLNISVDIAPLQETYFLSAWIDFNRDGDWDDDSLAGCGQDVSEWIVRNQVINLSELSMPNLTIRNVEITTDSFVPYFAENGEWYWMRFTLSDNVMNNDGSISLSNYCFNDGETEDYYVLYFDGSITDTCVDEDRDGFNNTGGECGLLDCDDEIGDDSSPCPTDPSTYDPSMIDCGDPAYEECAFCIYPGDSHDCGSCNGVSGNIEYSTAECRPSAGICDIAESCTGSSLRCPADAFLPFSTPCNDGIFCNGEEHCDGQGNCVLLNLADCSQYDLPEIARCDNDPDNRPDTWDYAPGFVSECSIITDSCTIGSYEFTHTCDVARCGAECDATSVIENKCVGDIWYHDGVCDLGTCTIIYQTEDCSLNEGWFDVGDPYWVNLTCESELRQDQEFRECSCVPLTGCECVVTNNRTVVLQTEPRDHDSDGICDPIEIGPDPSNPVDSDGDGIPDYQDTDSDNDGVPDSTEAGPDPLNPVDNDNDGTPDYQDTDDDGDGIPTADEGTGDSDGDGVPDYQDGDDDNDGIPTADEGTGDSDGDGVPDYQDGDSDGDGITDTTEAGGNDADGDGIIDGFVDNDNDGMDDNTETTPLPVPDTDSDGTSDYQDTDSDNDGVPDSTEGNDADEDGIPDTTPLGSDVDGDGIDDAFDPDQGGTPVVVQDTDNDGTPDYQDTDDDGDGIPTADEGTGDSDGDGIPDYLDPEVISDSDGDGIPDSVEGTGDTDGDGIPDYQDTDSDNDGVPDSTEAGPNPETPVDTDGDGIPDYQDSDDDNNGVPTSEEGTDDFDGDGIPDYLDPDNDNDGVDDVSDLCDDTVMPEGVPTVELRPNHYADIDGDGIFEWNAGSASSPNIIDSSVTLEDTYGCSCEQILICKPGSNAGEYKWGCTGGPNGEGAIATVGLWINQQAWAIDCLVNGVMMEGESKPFFEDTDNGGFPDIIDGDNDNDGIPDSEDSEDDSAGVNGLPGSGKPDWWCDKHPIKC